MTTGAAEILRSVGLLADGPVVWGRPLGSRTGGTPMLVMNGNRWIGPGHSSLFPDRGGQWWVAYHAVDRGDPFFATDECLTALPVRACQPAACEISTLLETAGNSRNPVRDRLLVLMAFRHALRVSELVDIRWQAIDLDTGTIG